MKRLYFRISVVVSLIGLAALIAATLAQVGPSRGSRYFSGQFNEIVAECEKRCREILTRHWPAVLGLADALYDKLRIEYEETLDILASVSPDTMASCEWEGTSELQRRLGWVGLRGETVQWESQNPWPTCEHTKAEKGERSGTS